MENLLKKIEYSGQSRHSRVHKNSIFKADTEFKKKKRNIHNTNFMNTVYSISFTYK